MGLLIFISKSTHRRYKSKIYIFYIISYKFNKIYLINNIVSRNKLIIIRNV